MSPHIFVSWICLVVCSSNSICFPLQEKDVAQRRPPAARNVSAAADEEQTESWEEKPLSLWSLNIQLGSTGEKGVIHMCVAHFSKDSV